MTEKDLDIAIEKCERIMEFDTRTLENPESENGHIFEKVYDLLQFLRQLQFATDTNVGGNLIDRQAALDAIKKLEKPAPTAQHLSAIFDCEDTIKALPSAQPGWIPTSERLPDNDRAVLVTLKWAEDDYEVAVGEYWHNSTASHGWGSFEGHVIAWHELPTPYREGGQDGKN